MRRQQSFTRADRLEQLMVEEVERLLSYELRSPLAQQVKVTGGRLSPDLGHLRILYMLHSGDPAFEALTEMLDKAGPFLSRTLKESLQLRAKPTVVFQYDSDAVQLERVRKALAASKALELAALAESETATTVPEPTL
jgi:ribosome-binding factor A